ncbi:hypothetical protein, partial [Roseovarius sp. A46]|uniref:hypothetical protein n=1 Tax=Roseovarius sp. A46 TaxID=2109331 RepID=UPI0013E903CD
MTLRDIFQSFATSYHALARWIANGWDAVLTEPILDWPLGFVVAVGLVSLCAGSLLMLIFESVVGPCWEKVVGSKLIQRAQVAWQLTEFDENNPTAREAFRSASWCGVFFAGLVLLPILCIGFPVWLVGGEGPDMIAGLVFAVAFPLGCSVFAFFVILTETSAKLLGFPEMVWWGMFCHETEFFDPARLVCSAGVVRPPGALRS